MWRLDTCIWSEVEEKSGILDTSSRDYLLDLESVAVIASDSYARGRGFETMLGKCRFSTNGSWKHYLNITLHLVVSLYKVYITHQMA